MDPVSALDFVAVDFETASSQRASVCQVGLTRVVDGVVDAEDGWLVVPPTGADAFAPRNVMIHHITPAIVRRYGISWEDSLDRFEAFVDGFPLVAHNAPFDRSVFERATRYVGFGVPRHRWEDTVVLARRHCRELPDHRLPTVAAHFGLGEFSHHDACADARTCALIATTIATRTGAHSVDELWGMPR